ncbi:MAG: hypothetical protein RLZZ283_624 [Candidatus Parcubacteria bacterium]|jgi:hypothetical protein
MFGVYSHEGQTQRAYHEWLQTSPGTLDSRDAKVKYNNARNAWYESYRSGNYGNTGPRNMDTFYKDHVLVMNKRVEKEFRAKGKKIDIPF